MTNLGLGNMGVMEVGKRAFKDFQDDDMSTYAAALTYRILLALFPFLIFLLTLLGALNLQGFFDWLLEQAQSAFPSGVYTQFETVVQQVRGGASGGLLSFGLIGALWAASGGIRSVMHAINVAYDVKEERSLLKKYPMSLLFTIGLAIVLISAVALMLLGPQVMEWLADPIGLGSVFVTVWTWLRIPVAIVLMMVAVAMVYYFFPNVNEPLRLVSPGSVVAVVAWVLASIAFSIYVSNFANYNATYGSLGGIIVLLLYFYISSLTLLFGAEVNAVVYKEKAATPGDNVEESERRPISRERAQA